MRRELIAQAVVVAVGPSMAVPTLLSFPLLLLFSKPPSGNNESSSGADRFATTPSPLVSQSSIAPRKAHYVAQEFLDAVLGNLSRTNGDSFPSSQSEIRPIEMPGSTVYSQSNNPYFFLPKAMTKVLDRTPPVPVPQISSDSISAIATHLERCKII
jgi:hypothetical protein